MVKTSKDTEKLIWDELLKEFNKAKSLKEVEQLFNVLTTTWERETIARRLAVLSLIRKNFSYKEISSKLWVSPLTISTIKKSMLGKGGYKSYHWIKKENIKKLKPINYSRTKVESVLDKWLDHIAFIIENRPRKNGSRWKFLDYGKK